jgi:pSer/pThr/pTyr-binding forkhead associated (FHA) protein
MACQSFLSSVLRTQAQRADKPFGVTWEGNWLVWEQGAFKVPPRSAMRTMPFTAHTGGIAPPRDVMCFFVGKAAAQSLVVGRDLACDIAVNDGTVSRRHVELLAEQGAWYVKVVDGREASLDGVPVTATGVPLKAGQTLRVGGVEFSFHDTASILQRIAR